MSSRGIRVGWWKGPNWPAEKQEFEAWLKKNAPSRWSIDEDCAGYLGCNAAIYIVDQQEWLNFIEWTNY